MYPTLILAKVLQIISEDILPESQCGFREARGTIDMIFTLRQLQEKCAEQNEPLYVTFVNFSKAFDTVSRSLLWLLLSKYGCPDKFISLLRSFHDGMRASVSADGATSDEFGADHGVKQGCVLAPTLFTLFLAAVMYVANRGIQDGVIVTTRTDGRLFNIGRLKAKTKVRKICSRDLMYADDTALVAHSASSLQQILDRFVAASSAFGLRINI